MKKVSVSAVMGIFSVALVGFTPHVSAELKVVTSIKPIHSLVSAVMDGAGSSELLIEGASSPHSYAMRPSQARSLQNADVVFWIGHDLETFLAKPIETTAKNATSVELIDSDGLIKRNFRDGHEDHDHGKHEEDKHDEHKKDEHAKHDEHKHDEHKHDEHKDEHAKHDEHKHDEHKHDEHKDEHAKHDEHKDDHAGHDHGAHGEDATDPHIWLDPENAKVMSRAIAKALSAADPANAALFSKNADALIVRLDQLSGEIQAQVKPLQGKAYVVFHDAYQYFEERYGLKSAGSVTVNPEVLPGADHLREIKEKVASLGATCVFSEPQFKPKLVEVVIEGTAAKSGVLDPLGANLDKGTDQYFELIRAMAASMRECIS